MATTLVRDVRVFDGSGTPSFVGSVCIDGDRIGAVLRENDAPPRCDREIDARGLAIAPGFIDMHSHADFLVPGESHDRLVRSFLEQGVTSIVAGNCGISPAPISDTSGPRLGSLASICIDEPLSFAWRSMASYLDHLDSVKPAVNVAQLVGHAALRYAASEEKRGELSASEQDRAIGLLNDSIDQGACGLSFGLGYDPGMYSSLEELTTFARAAAKRSRPVTVHLKAYSWISPAYPLHELYRHNVRALNEMLEVAERAEARLQISHLIFVGRRTWASANEVIDRIDRARARGLDVMFDAFPYTCGNTTVNVTLPYWFLAMGKSAYASRFARARLRAELEIGYRLAGFGWDDFQVMQIAAPEWEDLNGLTIAQIARRWRLDPIDTLLAIGERTDGSALMLLHTYSGDRAGRGPIEDVIAHEACLFETDAIVRSSGWPNPAAIGTFPKILADARKKKRFSIEDAIRRMTSASAARFALSDRGAITPGFAADLVLFDPETISDSPPSGGRPASRPSGIERVFVNGIEVVSDGAYVQGRRAGRVLRPE